MRLEKSSTGIARNPDSPSTRLWSRVVGQGNRRHLNALAGGELRQPRVEAVRLFHECKRAIQNPDHELRSFPTRLLGKKMLVALMMEGKFSGEGLQALDTDEDLMSAMARELVEKAGVGESADAVWRELDHEREKVQPRPCCCGTRIRRGARSGARFAEVLICSRTGSDAIRHPPDWTRDRHQRSGRRPRFGRRPQKPMCSSVSSIEAARFQLER